MNDCDGVESGPEFERRALELARAIHDPSGVQGAQIVDGQERDAVFIDDRSIAVYEFTISSKKDKATKDGEKLASILEKLGKRTENQFKARIGYFVTSSEPTADQRSEIGRIAGLHGQQIHALSAQGLRKQLFDSEAYLRSRQAAPFGSTGLQRPNRSAAGKDYVPQTFSKTTGLNEGPVDLDAISNGLASGARFIILGDYGAGKSEALYQVYLRARREYFRRPLERRVPLHVNLSDLHGLRYPAEILRRHAEDLGFASPNQLVSAWRAGVCMLILDGFDELVPARWVGGARDLKNVRRNALAAVRKLIAEMSPDCGVCIAGRAQYFSSRNELNEVLGLANAEILDLNEIEEGQVAQLVQSNDVQIPNWAPMKPLILKLLYELGYLSNSVSQEDERGEAWLRLIRNIANRESERIDTITPENVRKLLARTATVSRSRGDGTVSVSDMQEAFKDVCGYDPDPEGMQLIQRLPGLTTISGGVGSPEVFEIRKFADESLGEAAYGLDLAEYAKFPYEHGSPMAGDSIWNASSSGLAPEVASALFVEESVSSGAVTSTLDQRMNRGTFDGVTLDLAFMADVMEASAKNSYVQVKEVLIPSLEVSSGRYVGTGFFADCLIDVLDVSDWKTGSTFPTFRNCEIETVVGWNRLPDSLEGNFAETNVAHFSDVASTNEGLLSLSAPPEHRVALTILKKVYMQRGGGRRYSALVRGIPPELTGSVGDALDLLVKQGLLRLVSTKSDGIYSGINRRRADVLHVLEDPVARLEFLRKLI